MGPCFKIATGCGALGLVTCVSYVTAKIVHSMNSTKTHEEEKALQLYKEYKDGASLTSSELDTISCIIPMTEDDRVELMDDQRRLALRNFKYLTTKSDPSQSSLITTPQTKLAPEVQMNCEMEKLANAQITIGLSVLRSPYRAELQKLSRITDIGLRSLNFFTLGLAACIWTPIIKTQGIGGTAGIVQWVSLSLFGLSLGLNYLVREHSKIGNGNLKSWSKDRFSDAFTKADECSHLMSKLADGKYEIWRNEEKGIRMVFDKSSKPHRAFEVVSIEGTNFDELMLDLRSTFHGLRYSLQKFQGRIRFPFPDGPGSDGFLQIFQSKHPEKRFLKWSVIEYGKTSFNGGVILKGDILVIDDTLEGSILNEEYKKLLAQPGFMQMDVKDKLNNIIDFTYLRLKYDEKATNKVLLDVLWSKLPKNLNLGHYSMVLKLDHFITIGLGECRHRAALMGYLIERLVKEGHVSGEVKYLSNEDHGWIGFSCFESKKKWELCGPDIKD